VEVATVRLDRGNRRAGLTCPECAATAWLDEDAADGPTGVGSPVREPAPVPDEPPANLPPRSAPRAAIAPDGRRILEELPVPTDAQQALRAAFERLLERWGEDEQEHKKLVAAAAADDELAFVGQCYRTVLEIRRDDPVARRGQELVLARAMAQLDRFDASEARAVPGRAITLWLLAALTLGAIGFLVRSLLSQPAPGPASPAQQSDAAEL